MFDFPSPASEGQFYAPSGGPQYVYTNGAWRMTGPADVSVSTMNTLAIITSQTYTKPAGLKFIEVECQGAGGAGGGAPATTTGQCGGGGGGGAGGYGYIRWLTDDLPASFAITVGASGAGVAGTTGGAGGSTIIAGPVTVTAVGGNGGASSIASGTTFLNVNAGTGGAYTNFLHGSYGQAGQFTTLNMTAVGIHYKGGGGGSKMSWGGSHVMGGISTGAGAIGYGGGGSGDVHAASAAASVGGGGGPGIVILKEYF